MLLFILMRQMLFRHLNKTTKMTEAAQESERLLSFRYFKFIHPIDIWENDLLYTIIF